MEYLTKIIDQAAKQAGSIAALETALGLAKRTIYEVKGGRRGLPAEALLKLQEMTGADFKRLTIENEAITAKGVKAEFWKKKLQEFERMAAVFVTVTTIGTVTNFVTPSPAQAAPMLQVPDFSMYIMSNRSRWNIGRFWQPPGLFDQMHLHLPRHHDCN